MAETTAVTTGGGYDCDLVVTSSGDMLMCVICYHVLRNPQQSTCCGQNFCKECLDKYLKTNDTKCPFCRGERFSFVPDKKTERQALDLMVYCPHKAVGCAWKGELRSREKHLSDDCPFSEVQCSNGCDQQSIQHRLLEEHLKSECKLRQVNCEYCNIRGGHQWITGDHQQQECPKYEMNKLKQQLSNTQEKLRVAEQELTELRHKLNNIDSENKRKLSAFLALEWPFQLKGLQLVSNNLPAVIKMPCFNSSNEEEWCSPAFTTDENGYKMFMKVYASGYRHNVGYGEFVSVAVFLMKGEDDEHLNWPVKGILKVQLLNQLEDRNHSQIVEFNFNGEPKMCQRVTGNSSCAERACWSHTFIAHDKLNHDCHRNCQYLKDKCLFFRVQSFVKCL